MTRYELVEGYPGGPEVGTIVTPQTTADWYNMETIYVSEDGNFTFPKANIEEWPRFWKDADRDKRTMSQKMEDFINSPEGEVSMNKYFQRLVREEEQEERNYERFVRMVEHTGLEKLMDKIVHKYNSDEYVKREHKNGYQPREPLSFYAYQYFEKHGEETEEGLNDFMDLNYRIGNYAVGMMHGQGVYVKIQIL